MRHFIELSYLGTAYHGWQIQKNAVSVQEVLNKALSILYNESIETTGSSRTDTGVHTRQQFAHYDTSKHLNPDQVVFKLNRLLPRDIAVKQIIQVDTSAHSRFDAVARSYEYIISTFKNPFKENQVYHFAKPLDLDEMNLGAQHLLTIDNFQSFSRVKTEVDHFRCNVEEAKWKSSKGEIIFNITANRFLRGMVRALVGTMMLLGERKIKLKEFEDICQSLDRREAGRAVPAQGLYLTEVRYPKGYFQEHNG